MELSNLHEIQVSILKQLGYEEQKSFSELQGDFPSNKLAFHLNQLQEKNIIEKKDDLYVTTKKGREIIIEFLGADTSNPVTLLSLVICSDDNVYLEYQSNPLTIFKDMYRLPTDKVRTRERLSETAERIYRERTGEEPENFEKMGVFDKVVELKDGVEQRYLLFYLKTEYEGDLDNLVSMSELESLELIPGVKKVIKEVHGEQECDFVGDWEVKQTQEGFINKKFDL
ncbi:MAG: hypothetical protein H8Z69_04710 [Nanohaloarchaea archaeon]|nr:hypothetical protein [Candidatus Nanohaloarchaea archaeon]